MALSDSALSELLCGLRVGDGTDLVRELAQWALQQLIEAEAAEKIGAARYERSNARVTHRNGSRRKTLSTKAGDLVVGIPKLRAGSFFPSLLEVASQVRCKSRGRRLRLLMLRGGCNCLVDHPVSGARGRQIEQLVA